MNASAEAHPQRHMLSGTVRVFSAEALLLPTGLITAAFLTRKLGPSGYGLFTLAATMVAWIEWTVTSMFARATFKFVAEARDWRPVGDSVVRLHIAAGFASGIALFLLAPLAGALLQDDRLILYLRIFSLDIPLFVLAHAHRNILIGLGRFHERAVGSAGRWISRLILIVVLVQLGLSIEGAIWGSIGASLVELVIARYYVRPSMWHKSDFPVHRLWGYAVPLFLFAVSMRLYEKLDLVALKALGATAATAGIYGAAQNLSLIFNIFSLAFAPLLLSTLSNLLSRSQEDSARQISRNAIRIVVCLTPLTVLIAATSEELVPVIFGNQFRETAPILSLLIFGSLALAMLSVTTSILTAASRPALTFALAGPMIPVSIAGYAWMIPIWGSVGAALTNTSIAVATALISVGIVHRLIGALPAAGTILRSAVLSIAVWFASQAWQVVGLFIFVKLTALALALVAAMALLGEFRFADITFLRWNQIFTRSNNA